MNWFTENLDQIDTIVREAPWGIQPQKVVFKPAQPKELIFTDANGFSFYAHSMKIGYEIVHTPCLRAIDEECPLCLRKNRPEYLSFFSVIEIQRKNTDGFEFSRNYLKILSALPYLATLIKGTRKENGLRGCRFLCHRPSEYYDQPGKVFKFLGRVNLSHYGNPIPFDYRQIFQPQTERQLIELFNDSQIESIQKQGAL